MPRFLRIGLKDLLVQVRDLPALAVLLGMPMVLIVILTSALGGAGTASLHADVAVVDLDGGELAATIADAFLEDERLAEIFDTRRYDDAGSARLEVERGDLAAALVIPKGFTAGVREGRPVEVEVLGDPGQELKASIVRGVARSLGTRVSAASVAARTTGEVLAESRMVTDAEAAAAAVEAAAQRAAGHEAPVTAVVERRQASGEGGFDALSFYAVGMSVMFLLFGAMFGAFAFVGERTTGTLPRLLTTPASNVTVVAGKMTGIFVLGMAQFVVLYTFNAVLGTRWGSWAGVWPLAAAVVIATTGLAVAIASVARSERQVGAIGPIVVQVFALAGGTFFPIGILPEWLQPIHYVTPNGWAIDGFLALQEGASPTAVLPNIAALLGIGALFAAFGIWRLRTR